MNRVLFSAGCAWIIWATTRWKVSNLIWEKNIIKVCSWILGIYNILLAFWGKGIIGEVLLIIDFVLIFALDIYFFMIRLKKDKKGIMKLYQLGLGFFFIIIALWMIWLNLKKIYVGIATLTGAMIMISVPFQESIEILDKEKK